MQGNSDEPATQAGTESTRERAVRVAALTAVVLLAVGLSVFEINNDDAGFHVATGRYIRATGQVPTKNPFSYANDGATWVQHQWLPAVGISWVADRFGPQGLIAAKAAFVGLLATAAAGGVGAARLPAPWGSLALLIAVMAGAFRFKERPLLVSVLLLSVVVPLLLRWRDRAFGGWRLPLAAAVLPAFVLQLHAGGMYGLLVWLALVGGAVLQRDRTAIVRATTWAAVSVVLSVAGLAVFAPSGVAVLTLPFSFGANGYWHAHLAEFRPLPLASWAHMQWYAVGVVAVALVGAMRTRRGFEGCLLLGFGYLGVRHQRLILPMAFATVAAITSVLADPMFSRFSRHRLARTGAGAAFVLLLVVGSLDHASWHRMGLGADGFDRRRHPIELMDQAAKLPGPAFVSDGFAGVYLWRNFASNGGQVLVHNCLECYHEATYIDVYQHIRYGKPGWRDKVDKLGIRTFLIKHTSAGERRFQRGKANVRQHLHRDPEWLLVDFNDVGAIWTRRATLPANTKTLGNFPIDPDTGRPRQGAKWPEIAEKLFAHAKVNPRQTRALVILAHRAASVGNAAVLSRAVELALRREPADHIVAELTEVLRRFAALPP